MTQTPLPRILVVDDSLVERSLFVGMVSKWGYSVEVAGNAEAALERIINEHFQLVLVDWQMPGMPGTELCARIRHLALDHAVYVILMSARPDEEFLIEALQAGADDVLGKPVDGNELEARLQSAQRRIGLQTELRQQTEALSKAHLKIDQDLRAVSSLQRSYLPPAQSPFEKLGYRWLSVPSLYVSGDHLHVFELEHGYIGFYLLDVSGHGVPAAVKSMQLMQMLADQSSASVLYEPSNPFTACRPIARPSQVVGRLNTLFQQTEVDLSYFTLIYGTINPSKRLITLCQAGHPAPLLLSADGSVSAIGDGGFPVGLFDGVEFDDIEIQLEPGQALLLYSDGVTEVSNDELDGFGPERLMRVAGELAGAGRLSQLPEVVVETIQRWGGDSVAQGFTDDVSLLLLSLDDLHHADNIPASGGPEPLAPTYRLPQPVHAPPVTETESFGYSIVIVDDSKTFLRIFEAMLQSWGYTVFTARDGDEALDLIDLHNPDMVLTDWDMPGMSGIELCSRIRERQQSHVYVIMITGFAGRDDLLQSLRVGADDFMTKPVNPGELKVRLKTAERMINLHRKLASRHKELAGLYDSLQRDMREVSRMQRALLPKAESSPWPCAIQTLYQPREFVCGQQVGLLTTLPNELGFFMLNLPGDDTSTALRAIALARWFSMNRATDLLFPLNPVTHKACRNLSQPDLVRRELDAITPTLGAGACDFDLLYGLLDTRQGTLLVAGLGGWVLCVADHEGRVELHESHPGDLATLFENVITPGSKILLAPLHTARALSLNTSADWSRHINGSNHLDSDPLHSLIQALQGNGAESQEHLMLSALQWRNHDPLHTLELGQAELTQHINRCLALASRLDDSLTQWPEPLRLGAARQHLALQGLSDTNNIPAIGEALREFAQNMGLPEAMVYNAHLALSEALTNIMIHGYAGRTPLPVTVVLIGFEFGLAIVVNDWGTAIPESALEQTRTHGDFDEIEALEDMPEGGMGLKFMHLVSSRFEYRSESEGNTLTLLLGSESQTG